MDAITHAKIKEPDVKYPGLASIINGNGAVAHVMSHVCGGVIGYPITPSTEISETYENFRAGGGCNVWGRHPFFYEPEGEHSAQSGALGAALTGGKYISNASSSQGILYGLESHYVTVGKKAGGFVLQVAARVVSKHSLNVMAGHDDVYALLPSGYTILFGSNPQEAADLAAISYRLSSTSLIPVANVMDGFATSHMMSEAVLPEPELLKEYLGDPAGRIKAPTVAQEILFGAKGRVAQLRSWLARHRTAFAPGGLERIEAFLADNAERIEADNAGVFLAAVEHNIPELLRKKWARQWVNAFEKGTRQRVPAMVDVNNPGLTGGVQNQPDYQAGVADHNAHFVADVPRLARDAMDEYGRLTGRIYSPVMTYRCQDAETVLVGLGSVTQDVEAVVDYLRMQGRKVGSVSVKLLQPFPEAELVAALAGKKAVTVLERSDVTALTSFVTQALFKARDNATITRHPGIPAIDSLPRITTAIFGIGGHDLQSRHLVAAFDNMERENSSPLVYLGSKFFSDEATPFLSKIQTRLKQAYPQSELMTLETGSNPALLPEEAFRIRFHSVGGYGTIATGKLLTDILAGVLGLYSKSAPKYGSEKSGAPTNYYITLSPEPVKITNAEIEDVEIVISPDHKVFAHSDPLLGIVAGGTFILQSSLSPLEVWQDLPARARQTIRQKGIRFYVIDAFAVARRNAPSPELETRMMGIAFIGALCGRVESVTGGADEASVLDRIRQQIAKKFGSKGEAIVEGNMAMIRDGLQATLSVPYDNPEYRAADVSSAAGRRQTGANASANLYQIDMSFSPSGLFDKDYFGEIVARPFHEGTIGEAPVMPGAGMFMPAGSASMKDKGLFRRTVPIFDPEKCTGCLECTLTCPDAAMPTTVHDIGDLIQTAALELSQARASLISTHFPSIVTAVRQTYIGSESHRAFHEVFLEVAMTLAAGDLTLADDFARIADTLAVLPVSRTYMFFDQIEKSKPGKGGLLSVGLDPWKCSGCLECVSVCGADALRCTEQDEALLDTLQTRFEFLARTPNTPALISETLTGANAKRLILDRDNYYATTGGHGACRGCGEATALRLITSTNRALHKKQLGSHLHEVDDLLARLSEKQAEVENDAVRSARLDSTIASLQSYLYRLESGPTGQGPASSIIANSTGCSSVYSSTFPYTQYRDPWVNSLFQDAPALAKGIFEGVCADVIEDVKAMRVARLELEDGYDPQKHDRFFRYFNWTQFTQSELASLPTVFSMGGDGATYDIGFGALSRLLTTKTPIKVVVLNTGGYSNTGGQASTSSFIGQDADLARVGAVHGGKQDSRKELGLIAAFHPEVMVVQTTAAMQGHFLSSVLSALRHNSSPVVLDIYAPCQAENGVGDAMSSDHGRLAVRSRMFPLFVHMPATDARLSERFSLRGNPAMEDDWVMQVLDYVGEDGEEHSLETPLTPADFAFQEGRFKKQFRSKPFGFDEPGVAVHEYIDLGIEERQDQKPFIWQVRKNKLVRIGVGEPIVRLVEERLRQWRLLQELAGIRKESAPDLH